MKGKTAILLGATGLTGGLLLQQLVNDDYFDKVILFSRSTVSLKHPKIEEHLIDLFQLEKHSSQFKGDVVFCCVGSTQKKTPDKEIYKKVDFGIPTAAARLAKQNNIKKMIVVSALGADKNSKFFYNKTKGQMEEVVVNQQLEETYILQPSLIDGTRNENRPFEFAWKKVMKVANFLMIGPLKKYRSIQAKTIANSMHFLAKHKYPNSIIESEEIKTISAKNKRV
ncbi:NAD(P)H-binding [Mesonia phycicola]|uniref:NAD(P)H-binding n=1 Tax=Mesonia phycicola TaxID=579105 RepID=A0A1M6CW39_9FLAO|nr:NAD(P)H-binding protein [Mesonia phycicola]SHI65206.1 NAD(P)H-binding [Mesonia phycicola]